MIVDEELFDRKRGKRILRQSAPIDAASRSPFLEKALAELNCPSVFRQNNNFGNGQKPFQQTNTGRASPDGVPVGGDF